MEDIHKISQISINNKKSEFCFSSNSGIKKFDMENFEEKYSSDNLEFKLGSISLSLFLDQDNTLIFVGSKYNKDYPEEKIVFFDLNKKTEIFSQSFEKGITNVKFIDNFVYLCFDQDLKLYSLNDKMNNLELKEEYTLSNEYKNLFEVWEVKDKDDKENKIFLSYPYKKELIILSNTTDDWKLVNKLNIASPVNKIQNLFYIKKLNQLFICDENAIYIYSFDINDGKVKLCLRRGTNPGFITSMTLLNNNFLAIMNKNKTIHIFDLDINNNAFSFSNIVYSVVYGIQEIYPCIRIYFKDLIEGKEGEFVQKDFNSKGAILVSEDESQILNVIAYNGFAYKIKVNFKEYKYELLKKVNYAKPKNLLLKEGNKQTLSLFHSSSDEKEKEEEEK